MGNSVIMIEVIGNHGCERNKKDGEKVYGCNYMGCIDCETRRFVKHLGSMGTVVEAKLTHWPVQGTQGRELTPGAVIDDLVTGVRKGNF